MKDGNISEFRRYAGRNKNRKVGRERASEQEFADRTCISSFVEMSIAKEIRSAEHR